ncbi:Ig-like domain-containing protein [Hanstruepera ponticola]|uniref:Ig-like domain-containing protein n=1 Tax=Hanstruepera ponticola TaxID=2042995 RepID=UPI001F2A5C19|nr:Ig-like domain-containing protein [Hanstruepera ponticola]
MMKNYLKSLCIVGLVLVYFSCSDDDSNYSPLVIQANSDSSEVFQNTFVEIDVLANDINIPNNGVLTISSSTNATIEVLTNNTPNNPSDDSILYTPNGLFSGNDVFEYTICNDNQNCATGTVTVLVRPVTPVNYDPTAFPYSTLSEYNFFEGDLKDLNPVYGVIPYDINSALFSDYAHKKRFVWMPNGSKASYENDYSSLNFPVGSFLIKNFYYDNVLPENVTKIIETRIMYMTDEGWEFAKYVWNDNQTEATFTNDGSFVSFDWIEDSETKSVNYRIPSRAECFTCHNKFGEPQAIGPKPQNLNKDYPYNSGVMNQMAKWADFGYLEDSYPNEIETTVSWDDPNEPIDLRVRSYIDINCAHCHAEQSYCEYRPMRFAYNTNDDLTNMGVCVEPDTNIGNDYPFIMNPGDADASVVMFRISSIEEQYRMPLLGRTLQHIEGVELIREWMNSLPDRCE